MTHTPPEGYRPLDVESVRAFAAPFLPGPPEAAEEIGDGNVNLVFRVRGGAGSVIVKQALPYLRIVGEAWPLTLDRARIEAEALALEHRLAPGRVPRLLRYDEARRAVVMEDLAGYVVLRRGMIEARDFPYAFRHLGEFAAKTLLGTSDLLLPAAERKALARTFHNPELCAITEDLIFTSPFIASPSNKIEPALEPYAARLREDRAAAREAARLRFEFKTRAEAIVHGDLHTGSVMATAEDTRAIDPEFAFAGPMAFDTGKLLGNLALSYLAHRALGRDEYARRVARWASDFWESFSEEARRLWPRGEPWREAFLSALLADSARYAGAVMCRRTVGLAGVADIRGIPEEAPRLRAQREALAGGAALMTARGVASLGDLFGLATEAPAYQ
jgi:5-methylthioribose kinase